MAKGRSISLRTGFTAPLVYIERDQELNEATARDLAAVRGGMVRNAEEIAVPERFDAVPHPSQPAMIITDVESGKAVVVPLFAYREVRRVLGVLFA